MRKLTFDEIKQIAFGALNVREENDGIHFYKCTEKQNQAWMELSDFLGDKALNTSGVRLAFSTDSRMLRFDASSGEKFEVWINGLIVQQFLMDETHAERKVPEIYLGEGEKQVMLVFPSHSTGVLSYVEIDDGAYVKSRCFERKILFIGDSITQGWASQYDSLSFAFRTGMFFDADFVIQGVSGSFFHKATFDKNIAYDPDTVIVACGTNDFFFYYDVSLVKQAAEDYLGLVKQRYGERRVVVITPIWREDMTKPPLAGKFEQISAAISEVALAEGFEVIDGLTLVPHMPEFFEDKYLHPNDTGFGIYAENLIKALLDSKYKSVR